MKKKNLIKQNCIECGGELESSDNQSSHSNSRTCIKSLREQLSQIQEELSDRNSLRRKLEILQEELDNEIRKRNGWLPERRFDY